MEKASGPHSQARVLLADENKGFGGAERHVLTLAAEFEKLGILEAVVARKTSWLADNLGSTPLFTVGFRNEVDMLSVYSLYRKLKASQCNVLHCIGHRDLVASALARQLPGAPKTILVKAEHSYPDSHLSPLFRWAYGQCHAITSVSKALGEEVTRAVAPPAGVLTPIIANGIPVEGEVRSPAPLEDRPLHIGVLSPMRPGKGHSDFLNACTTMDSEKVKLSFAGDGELRKDLESQAQSLGLEVTFHGHLDDPKTYLESLDLSVVCSHSETFSLVTLETMFCGRPLLCADSEGVKELSEAYPIKLYQAGQVEELRKGLEDFIAQPQSQLDQALEAADSARTTFSSSRMAQAYKELYETLLR